jgi:hypothetical protein
VIFIFPKEKLVTLKKNHMQKIKEMIKISDSTVLDTDVHENMLQYKQLLAVLQHHGLMWIY